jgi:PKD repeat protein
MRVRWFPLVPLLGCSDTTAHPDPIGTPVAVIQASPVSGNVPLMVEFSGERSDWDGGIGAGYSYRWSFGDGNNAQGVAVHHTYVETGSYEACLTFGGEEDQALSDDAALTDTVCVTIVVR